MGVVLTTYRIIAVFAVAIGLVMILIENSRIYGVILSLIRAAMLMFEYYGGVLRVQEYLEEEEEDERFPQEGEEDEKFLEDQHRKLDEEKRYLAELEREKKEGIQKPVRI
jgi:hypothetical protein